MSLRDRIEGLDERERRLLAILAVVFVGLIIVLLPLGVTAFLGSKQGEIEEFRSVVEEIQSSRDLLRKRAEERARIQTRYANPAPALAGFLDAFAKESSIEIPESQDRAVVPHGKRFEEKGTKIVLRRVGMLNLVKFMEKIEQSGHPVSIGTVNIRKRGTEVDAYDVEMTVSAYERKAETATKSKAGEGQEGEAKEGETKEEP